MDKLNTTLLGGFPLELDDIRWMSNGFERAFKGICDGLGQGFILIGCELVNTAPNTYTITPGFVIMLGEVYEWPGVVGQVLAPTDLPNVYFAIAATLDPSGSEVFEDLTVQNAYESRRAQLILSPPGPLPPANARLLGDRLPERLFALLGQAQPQWLTVGSGGGFDVAIQNGWASSDAVYHRLSFHKGLFSAVTLRGHSSGALASATEVFTLPVGYRPAKRVEARLGSVSNVGTVAQVYILPNGQVHIDTTLGTGNAQFDLSGFPTFEAA